MSVETAFGDVAGRDHEQLWNYRASLAGRPGRLAYVGNTLREKVGPTFAHLIDGGAPDPDSAGPAIEFWDRAICGGVRTPPPTDVDWQRHGNGWQATSHGRSRYLREERPQSVFWLDRATACATAIYEDGAHLTLLERGRPLQRIMTLLCRSLGVVEVHAALVSQNGKGVLVIGGRGHGKTTTSIDCLTGGLDFLGDDSVGFAQTGDDHFTGYSLYGSARVSPALIDRWPEHRAAWLPAGANDEKAMLLPAISFGDRLVRETRIVAIALPVIGEHPVRSTRVSPRLAFDNLILDSGNVRRFRLNADEFAQIAALTRSLPCYRITIGPDPEVVAEGIQSLIE